MIDHKEIKIWLVGKWHSESGLLLAIYGTKFSTSFPLLQSALVASSQPLPLHWGRSLKLENLGWEIKIWDVGITFF